jgi:hypothetical protein
MRAASWSWVAAMAAVAVVASCSDGSGGGTDEGAIDLPADQAQEASDKDNAPHDAIANPKIAVNEVVHKTSGKGGGDWVELYNPGDEPVVVAGWKLKDDKDDHQYVLPAETKIGAKGFLLVYGKTTAVPPPPLMMSFALGDDDAVRLFQPDGQLVDIADWKLGEAKAGESFGRYPDGTGPYYVLAPPTPGAPNSAP